MPTCKGCGSETSALHFGGDANIPPPGLCDSCAYVQARAVSIKRAAALEAAAQKLAASGGN